MGHLEVEAAESMQCKVITIRTAVAVASILRIFSKTQCSAILGEVSSGAHSLIFELFYDKCENTSGLRASAAAARPCSRGERPLSFRFSFIVLDDSILLSMTRQ
jgi:hypothetical protein